MANAICNKYLRQKYCGNDPLCMNCDISPTCPIRGLRQPLSSINNSLLLLRGIGEEKKILLKKLDRKRLRNSFSNCAPLFQWDSDLAELAQAWADKCALVEYNNSLGHLSPGKIYHDSRLKRSVATNDKFEKIPGIAQTVHWTRSDTLDLKDNVLDRLIESDIQIKDGLIDELFTKQSEDQNEISWGQATHVGCGWIQFPVNDNR